MQKILLLFSLVLVIGLLSGCGFREKQIAPSDKITIPEGANVIICTKDDDTFEFIYMDEGIYQYFINGIEQSEDEISTFESIYLQGQSLEAYTNGIYDLCWYS